jgi:hypothetical protein
MVPFLIFLVILSLLVVLLSGWRRDRRLLGEARSALQFRGAERTYELQKANEDLKRAQAELQRRWQSGSGGRSRNTCLRPSSVLEPGAPLRNGTAMDPSFWKCRPTQRAPSKLSLLRLLAYPSDGAEPIAGVIMGLGTVFKLTKTGK